MEFKGNIQKFVEQITIIVSEMVYIGEIIYENHHGQENVC